MSGTGVAVLDYTIWSFRYPELRRRVPLGMAQAFFEEAGLYLNNSACSRVRDVGTRAIILGMITAHIAAMRAPLENGDEASPLVGRISNASEGSVSVATVLEGVPGTAAWWTQTKYGLQAWQALAPYRTARYLRGPAPRYDGVLPW
jgi:hypothetical protein